MRLSCKKMILVVLTSMLLVTSVHAKDHLIFSVAEDLPMGYDNEVLRRNYYVNIGSGQGVQKGTVLNVYRNISKLNPYYDNHKKRVNYKVKIGELEVLHSEEQSAIGIIKSKEETIKSPLFEINNFMIGDHVVVSVN